MNRRSVIKLAGATALASPFVLRGANAQGSTVKIGVVGPRTGLMASGAAVTHFPNFKLWEHDVNTRGGLKLKGGQKKVELIEYDDRRTRSTSSCRSTAPAIILPQRRSSPNTAIRW